MTKLVSIGVIGAGFMGGAHSECILASGKGELEIVAGRSEKKAKTLAGKYGYRNWTWWRPIQIAKHKLNKK